MHLLINDECPISAEKVKVFIMGLMIHFNLKCPTDEIDKQWRSILIKTITKFSNMIGYQQPDLSINWTVAHAILGVLLRCTLWSKLLGFSTFITRF